jgi:ATP-binding cassette subfamily B protein/subfamily B ATP-binding cassette protein MsbA
LIVVVENGRSSQIGTHAELMSKGGKYRTMVEQQIHMTLGSMAPSHSSLATAAEHHR